MLYPWHHVPMMRQRQAGAPMRMARPLVCMCGFFETVHSENKALGVRRGSIKLLHTAEVLCVFVISAGSLLLYQQQHACRDWGCICTGYYQHLAHLRPA